MNDNHSSIILNHLYSLHSFAFYILIFTFSLTSYGISSTKEYVRKNNLFMQNKANFRKVKFNVTKVLTKDYDQMDTWSIRKTKPIKANSKPIKANSKPIKANSKPIKANKMPKQTQFKAKQTQCKPISKVGYAFWDSTVAIIVGLCYALCRCDLAFRKGGYVNYET